jgi:hypothetical protein
MKQLPNDFYSYPDIANMTITGKELKELLLNTDGYAIIQGRMKEIKSKHLGAGVYRITVEDKYKKEDSNQGICPHNGPTMTHSNGDIECFNCREIIWKRE